MAPEPKLVAFTCGGAELTLIQRETTLSGGAKNLSEDEAQQWRRAKLLAEPSNGGDLYAARAFLEGAGWTCYWDGPAPRRAGKDAMLTVRVSPADKAWVEAHGGSDLIRRLIAQARAGESET